MRLFFLKKSKAGKASASDDRLEHFRKLLLDHLDALGGDDVMEKAGLPIGTIREWKGGRKYIKVGPGKWRPKYDSESRGAKMAIAAIRRKVAAAKDAHEMMQIVLQHRDRFSDKEGHPLPFVMDLHNYIMSTQDSREKAEREKATEEKKGTEGTPKNKPQAGKAVQPTGEDEDGQVNTPERGTEGKRTKEKISPEQQAEAKKKLENLAVPMMEVEYSREVFNRFFPRGTVKTPLHEVKFGDDLFDKLGRKDSGARQNLIGALYQTLTDPIVVIKEGNDEVYLKSFSKEGADSGYSTIIAVEKDVKTGRVIVTSYQRKEREIVKKIKMADGIAYLKDDSGSRANEDDPSLSTVSPESGEKSSPELEETEEEKRRNRSEAMKGNQNARKYGPKPQSKARMKAEETEAQKARARAGMPPTEKHGRTSTMKDSTWDPKSKDYRFRDTGYIKGSRKELAQTYIRKMAKEGAQVTNESIDWTEIEENDVAAAEIITKQNLMGKPDWEDLRATGLAGNAGYLINEIYKTINSKPEKSTADDRYNFSRGLDVIRGRLEACKTLDEVKAAIGDINGEMTGYYVSSIKTPEYLALVEKREAQNEKIKKYLGKLKGKIYEQGDPFLESDAFIKNKMGLSSGVSHLIMADGRWKGSYYNTSGKDELLKLLRKGNEEYLRRQAEIEERSGVKLGDMKEQLNALDREMNEVKQAKDKGLGLVNDMKEAWGTFGKSFRKAVAVIANDADKSRYWGTSLSGDETFQKHYDKAQELAADDFTWAEKRSTGGGGGPRKTQFELLVADHIVRNGGREVTTESTEALKNMFNLRDVQSGNWVLNDPKSAKFHVENIAMGLADLADITGIPDNLVSLNGRLAMAIGARGHSKALAHYEPVERVINITKMKGGGSLGHEWFHAFDNLLADAMTGGRYNVFLTENGRYDDLTPRQRKLLDRVLMYKRWLDNEKGDSYYGKIHQKSYENAKAAAKKAGVRVDEIETSDDYIVAVKNAFSKLATAMMTGTATRTQDIFYTKDDYAYINSNEGKHMLDDLHISKDSMDYQDAIEKVGHYRRIYGKKPDQVKRFITAYYDGNDNGGGKSVKTKETTSHYYENAKRLESNPGKPYWSSVLEMGARAFSAYLNDKMADRGWQNNYLAHATENDKYASQSPYPAGEEREAINAAFDELFRVINESNAIRKAIDLENMERIAPESAGAIDAAVNGALRFFAGLQHGRGSFDREKVRLNRAGESVEAYRWIAKGSFIEGEHPKDESGRFTESVGGSGGEKWFRHVLTEGELKQFIEDARNGKNPGNALIGIVSDTTKKKVQELTGIEVNKIVVEGTSIAHTDNPKHHLKDDDIERCAEVINNPKSVKLAAKTNEQGLKIVEFRGDIDGVIYFAEAVHKKHGGWLSLASAYRPAESKVSGAPMPPDGSPELTPETSRPMPSTSLSPLTGEKSSGPDSLEKSLTWSGYPLQDRVKVQGMDISIENKKGSTRSGTDKDGHEWHARMHYDYGYIRGTVGVDKDHLDCYIGSNPESEIVYIVNQNDPVTGSFDEQKTMLGFNSEEEAKVAYLKQYDRPGFFGGIVKMDIDTFKEEAFDPKNKGKPLKRRRGLAQVN